MDMSGMEMSHMDMPGMDMAMSMSGPWTSADLLLLCLMWVVMMAAMMAPAAAPMVLTFVTVNERRGQAGRPVVSTQVFLTGYLAAWSLFSVVATATQWLLHEAALLSPQMALESRTWAGALLLAAGIYQWTPLKHACLARCRAPLNFVMAEWREGARGAFIMGLRHGAWCVGCCWLLMGLLFVAGVMNLAWVAAIAAFVLLEKAVPHGDRVGRAAGVVLAVVGIALIL